MKKDIKFNHFSGLHLCGPENIAIIRICVITISISLLWPGIVIASGATPSVFTFLHGIDNKSLYDYIKTNNALLLNLIFPMTALIVNIAMKIYTDQLHQHMANSDSVFVIFGGKTDTTIKQEEKFSFPLGSVIGFPVLVLLTFLTSFASRHLRLLLFSPIQMSLITFVVPCLIVRNNSKIKQRAFNLVTDIKDILETHWRCLKKFRSSTREPYWMCKFGGPIC